MALSFKHNFHQMIPKDNWGVEGIPGASVRVIGLWVFLGVPYSVILRMIPRVFQKMFSGILRGFL